MRKRSPLNAASQGGASGKGPICQSRRRDADAIFQLGRSPGGGHGNPLQYSCLKNSMDRGVWQATVHRVAKSWTAHTTGLGGNIVSEPMNILLPWLKAAWLFPPGVEVQFVWAGIGTPFSKNGLLLVHMCSLSKSGGTLCYPMEYSLPGFSVHGIFQARILEWVAISFSKRFSRPKDQTCIFSVSCIGRWVLYHWSTWEVLWVPVLSKFSNWDCDLFFNRKFSALEMVVCVCVLLAQSCLTICNPMDCSSPCSSVHGILQARIHEQVAISFSRGSSRPRDWTWVTHITGRFFFNHWATREAKMFTNHLLNLLQPILGAYLSNTHAHVSVVWNRLSGPIPGVKQTPKLLCIFALLSLSFCYHSLALPLVFIMYYFNYSILLLWTLHR